MKKSFLIIIFLITLILFTLPVSAEDTNTNEEYKFAVLKEIKQNGNGYINPDTMTYEAQYSATLIVDDTEIEVALENNGYAVIGKNNYTAVEAYSVYRSGITSGGRVSYPYTSVAKYEKTANVPQTLKYFLLFLCHPLI